MKKKSKIAIDLFGKAEGFSKEIDALYVGKIEDVSKIPNSFKGTIYVESMTRYSDQWDSLFEKLKERVLDQNFNHIVSIEKDPILDYSAAYYLKQAKKNLPVKKILMYGDDQINSYFHSKVLNKKFSEKILIEVTKCEKMEDLTELFNQNKGYDLLLIDHPIFGVDEIELLEKIKKVFLKQVVLITTDVLGNSKQHYLQAGFDYFVSKPIDIGQFRKLIFSILEDPNRLTDREKYMDNIKFNKIETLDPNCKEGNLCIKEENDINMFNLKILFQKIKSGFFYLGIYMIACVISLGLTFIFPIPGDHSSGMELLRMIHLIGPARL